MGCRKLNTDIAQRDKYQQVLESKLKSEGDIGADSVKKRWEQLGKAIKAAADETIVEIKHKKNEEWFDKECAAYIREKNNAKQKIIQNETRSNYEEYQECRRKTNRIYEGKKRENMKKQSEEINQLNQQNEKRKFYKAVNNMKRGFQPRKSGCKGKDNWRREKDTVKMDRTFCGTVEGRRRQREL
jgi:hypothetical protein